jgi:predicted RecB family nuclease
MDAPITASRFYDLIQCPQRLALDLHGDPSAKDPVSAFVEMLWQRGSVFEDEIVRSLGEPFVDLSEGDPVDRERRTRAAIEAGAPLIYQGVLSVDGLLGIPDLMRSEGRGYIPIDIKSGRGKEGGGGEAGGEDDEGDGKPKPHYAA